MTANIYSNIFKYIPKYVSKSLQIHFRYFKHSLVSSLPTLHPPFIHWFMLKCSYNTSPQYPLWDTPSVLQVAYLGLVRLWLVPLIQIYIQKIANIYQNMYPIQVAYLGLADLGKTVTAEPGQMYEQVSADGYNVTIWQIQISRSDKDRFGNKS